MKTPAAVVFVVLASAACGGEGWMSNNPVGPGTPGAGPGPGDRATVAGMHMPVSNEFDYLTRMVPHHEEAIAAARALQRSTERSELRAFAATIIETQTAEVRQMQDWLSAWYPGHDTRVSYQPMMRDTAGLASPEADRVFLEDMIPHHMMAVMASQQLLARGLARHDVLVPFATSIRDTQQSEIRVMSDWLWAWYGAAPRHR